MPVITRSSTKAQQKAQKYAGKIWRRAIQKGVSAKTSKSVEEYIKKGRLAPTEVDQIFAGAASLAHSSSSASPSCPVIGRSNTKAQKKAKKYVSQLWRRAIREGITYKVREIADKIIRRGKLSRVEVDQILARATSSASPSAPLPQPLQSNQAILLESVPTSYPSEPRQVEIEDLPRILREEGVAAASHHWEAIVGRRHFHDLRDYIIRLPVETNSTLRDAIRQIIFVQAENYGEIRTREGMIACINWLEMFCDEYPEAVHRLKMGLIDQVLSMFLKLDGSVELHPCRVMTDWGLNLGRIILHFGPPRLFELIDGPGTWERIINGTLIEEDRMLLQELQRSLRVQMRRMGIQTTLDRLPENTEVRNGKLMQDHFIRVGSLEVTPIAGVVITDLCGIMDAAVRAGTVPAFLESAEDGRISREEMQARIGLLLQSFQVCAQQGNERQIYIREVLQHYTVKLRERINAAGEDQIALQEIYTEVKQTLFEELGYASLHCIDRQTQVVRQMWRLFCVNTEDSSIENQVITWLADRREAIADGVILDYLDEIGGGDRSSKLAAYKYAFSQEFGLSRVMPQAFFNVDQASLPEIRARFHATYNHETILQMVREAYQGPSAGVHPAFNYQNIEAFLASRISNILDFREGFFDEDEDGIPLDYPKDELIALYLQEMGILNLDFPLLRVLIEGEVVHI